MRKKPYRELITVLAPNLDQFAGATVRLTNLHSPSWICTLARYRYLAGNPAYTDELNGLRRTLADWLDTLPGAEYPL